MIYAADNVQATIIILRNDYLWSEGNFACDCNRALDFSRAVGEAEPDDPPCGETAYSIRISVGGRRIYDELERSRE